MNNVPINLLVQVILVDFFPHISLEYRIDKSKLLDWK